MKKIIVVLFATFVFFVGFWLARSGLIEITLPTIVLNADKTEGYMPSYRAAPGIEWTLVYIGSPTCKFCIADSLHRQIDELKKLLRARAQTKGIGFSTIGVAKSWDPVDGMRHLETVGRFDEVMSGRNWLNSGVVKYVWQDMPGTAGTPQLILLQHNIRKASAVGYYFTDETILARKFGGREIYEWLVNGGLVPGI